MCRSAICSTCRTYVSFVRQTSSSFTLFLFPYHKSNNIPPPSFPFPSFPFPSLPLFSLNSYIHPPNPLLKNLFSSSFHFLSSHQTQPPPSLPPFPTFSFFPISTDLKSWIGCGLHIPSVMDPVAVEEWCVCSPKVKVKVGGGEGEGGKEYPPMAK